LKVVKAKGDEWRQGEILAAFKGRGAVHVVERADGAALLERLVPGQPLRELVLTGRDDEATDILADVIEQMSTDRSGIEIAVVDFGVSFGRYLSGADCRIPRPLVAEAQRLWIELCRTQTRPRLLHGDLHHDNIIFDTERGWLAIDPKGVVGGVEFEIGAALRNPVDRPDVYASAEIAHRRICRFASRLKIDADRVRSCAFAQAVLSAIWSVEDRQPVNSNVLAFAELLRPLLRRSA
jgi:streptomycin 6-kinase